MSNNYEALHFCGAFLFMLKVEKGKKGKGDNI